MLRFSLPAVFLTALLTGASAQTIVINPNKNGEVMPSSRAEMVRVSLGLNMFVAAPGGESPQALKAQEDGRKLVYAAAAQECELLRSTIARDCTLESININVQYVGPGQNYAQRAEGYNINGTVNLRIVPK
jgi:hypothetical protein